MVRPLAFALLFAIPSLCQTTPAPAHPVGNRGWYRAPALYGNTVAFTAEGDLWLVGAEGGLARRLTSNPGSETAAVFSPAVGSG